MINITPPYGCIDISASHTIDHWQLHISNRTKSRSLISILFPSIFTVFPTQEYNNILIIRKIIHLHGGKINGDTNSKSNIIQIMVPRAYHFQNQPLPETKYKKVTSYSDESRMNEMRGIGTEIQRPHVLLIIADKSYSFHLNEVLSECYQVSILECPELTNNLLTDLNPNVIIIDEEVNGTPGNELCTQLKADRNMAKIPIILLVSTYENEGYSSHEISNADRIELRNGNIGIFKANIRTLINSHTAWKEQVKELTTTSFSSLNEESIHLGQCKPKDEESRIFMNKVNEILDKDIDIEQYTVDELCKKIGMCRTSLSARIKKYTGKSPKAYIISYKMRIAIKLLAEERYSIQEIATMLGFSTSKYFTKLFKKQYKICPSKYIQKG